MDNLKAWLGIAKPGGIDDFVIRVVKTFLAAFGVYLVKRGLDDVTLHVLRDAADAGWIAAGTIVVNALAALAPGEPGQKTGSETEVDVDA